MIGISDSHFIPRRQILELRFNAHGPRHALHQLIYSIRLIGADIKNLIIGRRIKRRLSHRPHDMDSLAERHLHVTTITYDDVTGRKSAEEMAAALAETVSA